MCASVSVRVCVYNSSVYTYVCMYVGIQSYVEHVLILIHKTPDRVRWQFLVNDYLSISGLHKSRPAAKFDYLLFDTSSST